MNTLLVTLGVSLAVQAVFFVFSPVQRLATGLVRGVGAAWRGYFDLRRVRADNEALKREAFFLRQDVRFLEDRLRYYRAEAEMKDRLAEFRGAIVPARVIGVDSANPHQSIVIDKGSLDGVGRDMAVCDRNGALVGRTIAPVSLKEAMVQLITDKDSAVGVESVVAGLTGSLAGLSEPRLEMRYVLATAEGGSEGEEVRTTGFDRIYPPGLRVGRISRLERDEASPIFRRIFVEPYFGFDTLDVVAVLTGPAGGGR
jgi:rod shape-determining protein MreC